MTTPAFTRGDYFAEGTYLKSDLKSGILRDRAGTPMIVLPAQLLGSMQQVLSSECGVAAERILKECGRSWGRDFGKRFERELSEYYGTPLADWPFARLETCVTSALAHFGWGQATLDTRRFDQGVLVVTVRHPAGTAQSVAPQLLAGALAGLFATITGQDLDALPTGSAGDEATFVLGLRTRLERVPEARRSAGHSEILDELTAICV